MKPKKIREKEKRKKGKVPMGAGHVIAEVAEGPCGPKVLDALAKFVEHDKHRYRALQRGYARLVELW